MIPVIVRQNLESVANLIKVFDSDYDVKKNSQ